jgi:hypothetical protein
MQARLLEGSLVTTYEVKRIRKDGSAVWVSHTISPVYDDDGTIVSLSGICRDVSEQRRLRQDRERLLEAERRSSAELAAQNERLRELDRLKDDFVASVSHELRTPLTSIRGYLELVLEDEEGTLSSEQQAFLRVVDRNSERLLGLVGDLLDVAQVDAGRLQLDVRPVPLPELVADCVERARPVAEAAGVALSASCGADAVVLGDPARLAQIVDNLLSNAAKFTPSGGTIEVTVREVGATAEIAVADTGMGIPESEQGRLFERFFRSSRATEEAIQGTGLGLWITWKLAQAHGGEIRLESVEGEGTTFTVALGLAPAASRAA